MPDVTNLKRHQRSKFFRTFNWFTKKKIVCRGEQSTTLTEVVTPPDEATRGCVFTSQRNAGRVVTEAKRFHKAFSHMTLVKYFSGTLTCAVMTIINTSSGVWEYPR